MEAIHVNNDPKGWSPCSVTLPQLPGVPATDDLSRLFSFIDFGQKVSKREDDFDSFSVVDNKLQSQPKVLSRYNIFSQKPSVAAKPRVVQAVRATTSQRPAVKRIYRDQTVSIKSNWNMIAELSKLNNEKLSFEPNNAEDVVSMGTVLTYKKTQDSSVSTFTPKVLNTKNAESRGFITTTASTDQIMLGLSNEASVFITDTVLVALMTMNRSVYPWDIQVTKANGKIYFDKSEESSLEQLTMNENNPDNMPDEDEPETSPNNPKRLADEALRINRAFFLNSITEPTTVLGPSISEDAAPVCFKYRKWKLSEGFFALVRTEVDAVLEENDSKMFIKLFAVNEYDARITGGYKEKLETQKGQIYANEIKNNSCKISKWALKAFLAGVEFVKIGYVSRVNPKDTEKHILLHVQKIRARDLMQNLNLAYNNCWGVFKSVVEVIRNQPDGKFAIVKDPLKPVVKIYHAGEDLNEDFDVR